MTVAAVLPVRLDRCEPGPTCPPVTVECGDCLRGVLRGGRCPHCHGRARVAWGLEQPLCAGERSEPDPEEPWCSVPVRCAVLA